jgi:ferric-dicitrate binding protein FerR (iron transport regulator)
MNIEQLENIIDRYLSGLATPGEKECIAKWLETTPTDTASLEAAQRDTIKATLWQSVAMHTGVVSHTVAPKTGVLRQLIQRRTWWQYAAAVVIILAGSVIAYNGWHNKQPHTSRLITALPGSHKTLLLPDSSTVHLFPGASISIPDNYNQTERRIASTGRVFFEVKPDASRPFYVQCGQLRTRVLGTSFEVMSNDLIHSCVIVRTGKVGVQYGSRHLAYLTPGKRLRFNARHNEVEVDEVNAAMLCEWWNNGMVFNQAPLEEVMQTLANWYNKPIEITSNKWKAEPVTIRIKQQGLPEALSLLSQTLGFHYRLQNDKVFIY